MRDEENVFLERLGADYAGPLMEDGITFDGLKEAFEYQKINLEMDKTNVTWIMSESLLGEIEKAMADLLAISEKPRTFIETHDEKVLVESASHIGHKAIAQLSRDSKDWYARTFVSVKPKNITAEISEETFNIYENRVFVSLIRRLEKDIYIKKKDAEDRLRKEEETLSSKDIDDYLHLNDGDNSSAWSFGLYKKAIWRKNGGYTDDAELTELRQLIERIDRISRRITRIKSSPVYKSMRKVKSEHSPILYTNIFLYDHRYKKALELWKSMDNEHFRRDEEISDRQIDTVQAEINYGLYVLLTVFYAFADLNFEASPNSGKIFYDYKEAYADSPIIFRRGNCEFRVSGHTKDNELKITFENASLKQKKRTFIIHINYENFEDLQTVFDFDKETKRLLDAHPIERPSKFSEPIHHLNCISFDGSTKMGDLLDSKLARRILSFGDSFSEEEEEKDLERWANYQTGFLDIVPQKNFRNNLLKIERFIAYVSLERMEAMDFQKFYDEKICPVCGGKHFIKLSDTGADYRCGSCHHLISSSRHDSCRFDKEKHPFVWVKPDDMTFLEKQKERFHFEKGQNLFLLYQFTQFIFGKYATTGFSVSLDEEDHVQYNTICPKCGGEMK